MIEQAGGGGIGALKFRTSKVAWIDHVARKRYYYDAEGALIEVMPVVPPIEDPAITRGADATLFMQVAPA